MLRSLIFLEKCSNEALIPINYFICYASLEDAVEQLNARMMTENVRYRELYGVDHLDLNNFDLVINTENISPEETCKIIMSEFDKYCSSPDTYTHPCMFYMDGAVTSVK